MALSHSDISAVLITRGDVDLTPVLKSLPFEDIVIVSNQPHIMYDRFLAVEKAKHDLIFVQDDDCIISDISALLRLYEPGRVLCNMPQRRRPEYADGIALIGWGSVFHKDAVKVLDRYLQKFPYDRLFELTADRVFTGLNPLTLCDVPFEHLPHAYGKDRMGAQNHHLQDLADIRQRIYQCR